MIFLKYVDDETFVYLDPPYIPISNTSNFTNYTHLGFKLEDHIRLSKFVKSIDKRGGRFLLSNSDPKNVDPDNGLIENLYGKFNISRVPARRVINSDPNKRGYVYEVLVKNLKVVFMDIIKQMNDLMVELESLEFVDWVSLMNWILFQFFMVGDVIGFIVRFWESDDGKNRKVLESVVRGFGDILECFMVSISDNCWFDIYIVKVLG